ncbi:hypothetical protein HIM_10091 [Hirsutella minnesotensis 3608]|uniref:Uncharacterized protein n=1 Tax=Hirsutella minnesotensis 3608 TaxID=1043627 RepID=A0A0F7ZKF1_9HYPO|nr:hypothetical protein HIM_10091 [Hirsutella minnesotensis 3608]
MSRPAPACEPPPFIEDDISFSLVSTAPDGQTIFSNSDAGQETDDFDFLTSSRDPEPSCGESTSISPSVYDNELVHGRRYHGYRKGRYPFPNDAQEQQREEMMHALMLEITVCPGSCWLLLCNHIAQC